MCIVSSGHWGVGKNEEFSLIRKYKIITKNIYAAESPSAYVSRCGRARRQLLDFNRVLTVIYPLLLLLLFFKSIILTDTYPCRNLILFFLRHLSTRRYSICPMQMCYSFFFFFSFEIEMMYMWDHPAESCIINKLVDSSVGIG